MMCFICLFRILFIASKSIMKMYMCVHARFWRFDPCFIVRIVTKKNSWYVVFSFLFLCLIMPVLLDS